MKYKTKPTEIEAVQFFDSFKTNDIKKVFPDIELDYDTRGLLVWDKLHITWVHVKKGDYIIRGTEGEYYPCDPKVFEAKYEEVNE